MIRTIAVVAVILLAIVVYRLGGAGHRMDAANARAETLERLRDADIGNGDADDDRDWLDGFLGRMPAD